MAEPDFTHEDRELLERLRSVTTADRATSVPGDEVWAAIESADPTDLARGTATAAVSLRGGRRNLWLGALAGAAAIAVAVAVVTTRDGGSTVVAATALSSDDLPGAPAGLAGDAKVRLRDGQNVLHVSLQGVEPTSGEFLALWLIKPDISGMVSLGTARADGDYVLPAGLSIAEYAVVDVSSEPYDGKPTHSGASLVRGRLI
jgi:anti-sigma-K factor RskA